MVTPKQHTKHVHLRNNKFHSEQAEKIWNYQFLALRKGAFIVNMGVSFKRVTLKLRGTP
jgi:hypothetical protein